MSLMNLRNLFCACMIFLAGCNRSTSPVSDRSVQQVMDDVITRLYQSVPPEKYDSIDDKFMAAFLSPEEKAVLSTQYMRFTINVPATVSLMRDVAQSLPPFWLEGSGFVKTDLLVRNESYTYEVWQKKFDAGKVSLGINGFDKHRPVYFISVGPQNKNDDLQITDIYPEFPLDTMAVGAFVYHDWSDLVLTQVPDALVGQKLFTTVRGRAREAHVKHAFRRTIFPSSAKPDQIMLTWSASPETTVDVQWRSNTTVEGGKVQYWLPGSKDTATVTASVKVLQDRMLYNDRYTHRYTAHLTGLQPGTGYAYRVGSGTAASWSAVHTFKTAPANGDKFSFVWFGDTHCFPDSGKLVALADRQNKDIAFYSIAGDLVSTGLYQDEWDRLFGYSGDIFSRKPLMPVLGNHDRQDGLGAQLYYDLFSLPKNGPPNVEEEGTYAFEYGNALFLMIDATSEVRDHITWIDQKLSATKATWKFVMFHFPPYNFEEPYPEIQQAWVPLFDKHHVDMVMGGHIHYYMRSKPMHGGRVVDAYDKGTVYTISISIPSKHNDMAPEPYAVKQYGEGYFYQRVEIDGRVLKYKTVDSQGVVKDEFVIRK